MKTSNDLISILLSSYNSEKTIRNSIKSILKQNYSNFPNNEDDWNYDNNEW